MSDKLPPSIFPARFQILSGSMLNPGTVIGRNTNIYPLSPVRGCIPADSIYKNAAEIIKKN